MTSDLLQREQVLIKFGLDIDDKILRSEDILARLTTMHQVQEGAAFDSEDLGAQVQANSHSWAFSWSGSMEGGI